MTLLKSAFNIDNQTPFDLKVIDYSIDTHEEYKDKMEDYYFNDNFQYSNNMAIKHGENVFAGTG